MNFSEIELRDLSRKDVLILPNEQKMQYLKSIQVKHKKLEMVAKDLMRLLSPHNETNILGIIGATGVGKTTLSKRLIKSLIETHQSGEILDPSSIPFIFIAAPANGDRSISWTTFYEKILREANEILIQKKQATIIADGLMTVQPRRYKTLAAMRESLESMLKHRKVRVLVIDEAFHLLRFGNYSAVMDTLKSLTDQSGVKLVLLGSYDLFDLASDYGQVARRAEILHFERYDKDSKIDTTEFKLIIGKLQKYWPCEEIPNFSAISEEILEASLGCVGLLKSLMLQALSLQLENKGRWDPRFMSKAAKSLKLLDRIRIEIQAGEDKVKGATYGETLFSGRMLDEIIAKMSKVPANV
jgi:energy-coupling factor transporter ATP-binding protein EcfA2